METVFLIGYSGCGKSVIGKLLAARKNKNFINTNEYIEKKEDSSILEIYEKKGETYFRNLEKYVLDNVDLNDSIVSLGSGIANDYSNLLKIKQKGKTIFLRATVETLYNNLKEDFIVKPYIKDNYNAQYINELYNKNINSYYELSNYVIDVDNKSINDIFSETLFYYNKINKITCKIFIM